MRELRSAVKGWEPEMEWTPVEGLGLIAGCMTTSAFVPQVFKTYRTRSVKDISLRMYLFMCIGVSLWVAYGFLIESLSVIAANIASLALTLAILAMKVLFAKENRQSPK